MDLEKLKLELFVPSLDNSRIIETMRIPQTQYETFMRAVKLHQENSAIYYYDRFFTKPAHNFDTICCMLIRYHCYRVLSHVAKKYRCTVTYSDMFFILIDNYTRPELENIVSKLESTAIDLKDLLHQAIESLA